MSECDGCWLRRFLNLPSCIVLESIATTAMYTQLSHDKHDLATPSLKHGTLYPRVRAHLQPTLNEATQTLWATGLNQVSQGQLLTNGVSDRNE